MKEFYKVTKQNNIFFGKTGKFICDVEPMNYKNNFILIEFDCGSVAMFSKDEVEKID